MPESVTCLPEVQQSTASTAWWEAAKRRNSCKLCRSPPAGSWKLNTNEILPIVVNVKNDVEIAGGRVAREVIKELSVHHTHVTHFVLMFLSLAEYFIHMLPRVL